MHFNFRGMFRRLCLSIVVILFFAMTAYSAENTVRKITLAAMPFEPSVGELMPDGGYCVHIASEAFKRAGYPVEVNYVPWARALEGAKAGVYDGVLGIYYNEERSAFLAYTDPLYQDRNVFFKRTADHIDGASLKDLTPYTIGIVQGASFSAEFDSATYLKKEAASSNELNIKKLVKGRIDLFAVEDKNYVLYLVNTQYPEWKGVIEPIDIPLGYSNLHVAISRKVKGYQAVVDAFNKGLREIVADGTMDRILKGHGMVRDIRQDGKLTFIESLESLTRGQK